jgi:hypothetical protein
MKYIYLSIFLGLLVATTVCDQSTFLKKNTTNAGDSNETPEPKTYQGFCFMKMKNNFYDLNPFNMIKPWTLKDNQSKQIQFNFCTNIDTSCHPNDVLIAEPTACRKFAGKADEEKTWTLSKDKSKNDVLSVRFPPGDSCGNGNFYETTVELTCDRKINVPVISNNKSFDQKKCQNVIRMRSKHGKVIFNCSLQFRQIQRLVEPIRYPKTRISWNPNCYRALLPYFRCL